MFMMACSTGLIRLKHCWTLFSKKKFKVFLSTGRMCTILSYKLGTRKGPLMIGMYICKHFGAFLFMMKIYLLLLLLNDEYPPRSLKGKVYKSTIFYFWYTDTFSISRWNWSWYNDLVWRCVVDSEIQFPVSAILT